MTPVAYLITDRRRGDQGDEEALVRRIGCAARAGVHLIQIRERDLPDAVLGALVSRVVDVLRGTRTRVLVNDRLDVALAAGAHGVHLRADSAPAARFRALAPHGFLIGRSVHSAAEAARISEAGGVDFLLFGTLFDTRTKPGQIAAGLEGLKAAVTAVPRLPVLAIGGITPSTAGGLGHTGCAGYGAIGAFADADESQLGAVVDAMNGAWEGRG